MYTYEAIVYRCLKALTSKTDFLADAVLDLSNIGGEIDADKGYLSKASRQRLKTLGCKDCICAGQKGNKVLIEYSKRPNKRFARNRTKIEHIFAGIRHMGSVSTCAQLIAAVIMTMVATCHSLKRLVLFLDKGVDLFYKANIHIKSILVFKNGKSVKIRIGFFSKSVFTIINN